MNLHIDMFLLRTIVLDETTYSFIKFERKEGKNKKCMHWTPVNLMANVTIITKKIYWMINVPEWVLCK